MDKVITKYRISTADNSLVISYIGGWLRNIEVESLADATFLGTVEIQEAKALQQFKALGIAVRQLPQSSTQQKIALWCELYKFTFGLTYKVSQAEAQMIKSVPVTKELVLKFFDLNEWWSQEKTIGRYTKNINEIRRISAPTTSNAGTNRTNQRTGRSDLAAEFQRRFGNKQ